MANSDGDGNLLYFPNPKSSQSTPNVHRDRHHPIAGVAGGTLTKMFNFVSETHEILLLLVMIHGPNINLVPYLQHSPLITIDFITFNCLIFV